MALFAKDSALTFEATARINMAVADFTGLNVSQADASITASFLRSELVNLGSFNIMDRNNMDIILAEQKFQSSGCTEQECAVQMGKLLNVQQIAVGSLSKLLEVYYITINLISVETGKIFTSYTQEASSATELREACRILAQKIQAGGKVPQETEGERSPPQPILKLRKTQPPETKNPPVAREWAMGVLYPGVALKYGAASVSEWEIKTQSDSGILILGLRNYRYFTQASNPRLFYGIEADYITFKGKESKGLGFAGEAFIGGEIFLTKQIGLAMDFGPMYISLNDNKFSESVSGLEYVLNMGIYWHFK